MAYWCQWWICVEIKRLWIWPKADVSLWQNYEVISRAEESSVQGRRDALLFTLQATWILVFFICLSSSIALKEVVACPIHSPLFAAVLKEIEHLKQVWCLILIFNKPEENSENGLSMYIKNLLLSPSAVFWRPVTLPKQMSSIPGLQTLSHCLAERLHSRINFFIFNVWCLLLFQVYFLFVQRLALVRKRAHLVPV